MNAGTLSWNAATTSTGGTIDVAQGAELDMDFALRGSATFGGTYTGAEAGTLTLDSFIAGGSQGTTFDFTGNGVTWLAGQVQALTNLGVITLSSTSTKVIVGTFTNSGAMIFGPGNSSLQLGGVGPDGGASGALTNAAGGTIDFQAAAGIVAGDGGALVTNAGTLTNSPDTGTTTISVELDNTGTVVAASGTLFLSGSVDQISGGTLEAGTWIVDSAATLALPGGTSIATNNAAITLLGTANFPAIAGLSSNNGSLTLGGDAQFSVSGNFSSSGSLTLGVDDILSVVGNFAQTSTGSLSVSIGGRPTTAQFGQLKVKGTATLAGTVTTSLAAGFGPTRTMRTRS